MPLRNEFMADSRGQRIGKSCRAADVTTGASIAQSLCNKNGYPLAVSSAALISFGMAAILTSFEASTTDAGTTLQQVVVGTFEISDELVYERH